MARSRTVNGITVDEKETEMNRYYIDPDPQAWGESCPDDIAARASEILADMVEAEFPGIVVRIRQGRNYLPELDAVDDWITGNYLTALEQAGEHKRIGLSALEHKMGFSLSDLKKAVARYGL